MTEFAEIWTYLSTDPLLWLTLTLATYGIGDTLFKASGQKPYVNPVLIAVAFLAVLLQLTGTSYNTYFEGAKFVHFMLGPATVALAIPLYSNLSHIKQAALPMAAALVTGSLSAMLSAVGIAFAFGLDAEILLALIPKSATAPVALGVSEAIGGSPSMTAVFVITTGITGAIIATPLLNLLGTVSYTHLTLPTNDLV